MPYDDFLVVKVRTPYFPLVLAARGEHASGWGIVRALYHLTNEAELPRGNHILDAWDIVKHLTTFLFRIRPSFTSVIERLSSTSLAIRLR